MECPTSIPIQHDNLVHPSITTTPTTPTTSTTTFTKSYSSPLPASTGDPMLNRSKSFDLGLLQNNDGVLWDTPQAFLSNTKRYTPPQQDNMVCPSITTAPTTPTTSTTTGDPTLNRSMSRDLGLLENDDEVGMLHKCSHPTPIYVQLRFSIQKSSKIKPSPCGTLSWP